MTRIDFAEHPATPPHLLWLSLDDQSWLLAGKDLTRTDGRKCGGKEISKRPTKDRPIGRDDETNDERIALMLLAWIAHVRLLARSLVDVAFFPFGLSWGEAVLLRLPPYSTSLPPCRQEDGAGFCLAGAGTVSLGCIYYV